MSEDGLTGAGKAPHPISSAPKETERTLLLYCPEQGGWHVGKWLLDKWAATIGTEHLLNPTHWMDVPSHLPSPWTREKALELFKMYEEKGWAVKQQMVTMVSWVTPIVFGLLGFAAKEHCSPSSGSETVQLVENLGPLASATASLIASFMALVIFGNLNHAENDYAKADKVMSHASKLDLFPADIQTLFKPHIGRWWPWRLLGGVYVFIWWMYVALAAIALSLTLRPEVLNKACELPLDLGPLLDF
jgi:hypothetical protein